jgi:aryl-alcohol dehydrogenase-like predicted oxidoreductase
MTSTITTTHNSFMRPLGSTGLQLSALGLGTVKIGRNEQVKYPTTFSIPDDVAVSRLLAQAHELGINLIDTAPAYGNSEERLGQLLPKRQDWVLVTKVGEEFIAGKSVFDFSAAHTRASIERSLKRLQTDYLDIVLIHSDGDDEKLLADGACIAMLRDCQQQGLIRAIGMSTKTIAGGLRAVDMLDVVMVTCNLQQQDQAVIDLAQARNKGALIKKGLMSGHVQDASRDLVKENMVLNFSQPGITSMIIGTINPQHLASNVATAKAVLANICQAG